MANDFNSIDRLIEFGMGLTLAKQMIETMNHSMANMKIPGSYLYNPQQPPALNGGASIWFAAIDGRQAGPLSEAEVSELVKRGKISEETLLWRQGLPAWKYAREIPEINKILLLI